MPGTHVLESEVGSDVKDSCSRMVVSESTATACLPCTERRAKLYPG